MSTFNLLGFNLFGRYAQRVVHPNLSRSEPFIAPLSKGTMVQFAARVNEGYWPRPADQFPPHEREALGTCRIECVFGGRFRRTLELWGLHGDYATMQNVHGRKILSYGDILIAFMELSAGGACSTYNKMRADLGECEAFDFALARTTIEWAGRIEEWPEP